MAAIGVSFPDINAIRSCDYTVAHGHQVGVARLEILPQSSLPTLRGTLSFTDGTRTVSISDCLINQTAIQFTEAGHIQTVPVMDFRWKWQDATIYGTWNVRKEGSNEVDPATEKTPRELATLLYTAMGIPSTDVSAIPNTDRPNVEWDGDKAWAAADKLLALYGCSVAPDFTDGSVKVVLLGSGATLPSNTDVQGVTIGASFDPWPDKIRITCSETVRQGKIKLRPVGVDRNSSVKIPQDLAYAPDPSAADGGFGQITTEVEDLIPTGSDLDRGLANFALYRWFQIHELVGGATELTLPGGGTVPSIQHILPLRRKILLQWEENGEWYESEPVVQGTWFDSEIDPQPLENKPDWSVVRVPFTIDRELGIVKFQTPIFKRLANGAFTFPDLYLTAAYYRQDSTKQYEKYYREKTLASNGTPTAGRGAKSLTRMIRGVYTDGTLDSVVDNQTDLDTLLDTKLDDWSATYTSHTAGYQRYRGVQTIALTGQIRAVRWVVDCDGGVLTYASQNSDWIIGVPSLGRRLRRASSEPRFDEKPGRRRRLRGRE